MHVFIFFLKINYLRTIIKCLFETTLNVSSPSCGTLNLEHITLFQVQLNATVM